MPKEALTRWLRVESCPLCGNRSGLDCKKLQVEEYRFGGEVILIPEEGVAIIRCAGCGLAFKDTLPSPDLLAAVFTRQAGGIWLGDYDYADEVRVIRERMRGEPFDVLDIGPANGGLLRALNDYRGRRSALDLVTQPSLKQWVRGEFIHDFIDSGDLLWSGIPYDVVTMFDLLEHLYNPNQAFSNLRRLVKPDGFVVIETGDLDSYWSRKFGPHRWWYASLFEHHVFWSKNSLEHAAAKHGFSVVDFESKRHKELPTTFAGEKLVRAARAVLYKATPTGYTRFASALGKTGTQPWSPVTRDHFRAILQK